MPRDAARRTQTSKHSCLQTVPKGQPARFRLWALFADADLKKEQARLKFTQAGEPGHSAFHVSTERMTEMGRWGSQVHWEPEKLHKPASKRVSRTWEVDVLPLWASSEECARRGHRLGGRHQAARRVAISAQWEGGLAALYPIPSLNPQP